MFAHTLYPHMSHDKYVWCMHYIHPPHALDWGRFEEMMPICSVDYEPTEMERQLGDDKVVMMKCTRVVYKHTHMKLTHLRPVWSLCRSKLVALDLF